MEPSPFKPRAHVAHDLRTPMSAGVSRLAPEDREQIHARRMASAARLDPFGQAAVRRVRKYVLASMICIPLITAMFTTLRLDALWIQLPMAALYGVLMASLRPRGVWAAFLLLGIGLLTLLFAGRLHVSFWSVMGYLAYFVFGMAVGITENMKALDGD
ncbi:MAG: hypothetical protein ACYTG6_00410 [Planctomycetota bacterium]|jgi:hypothetical protein